MTRMSRLGSHEEHSACAVTGTWVVARPLHWLVRPVLSVMTLALLLTVSAGCILLQDLEVESNDAGVSSPPVIESAGTPFEFPGPFTLARDDVDSEISLTLLDNDTDDTLHVRLFLDYDIASGAFLVSDCTAPASGTRERVVRCPADRICTPLDSADTSQHVLEVVVTDRDWLTAGSPDAEAQPPLREIAPDANRIIRGWSMSCQ